MSLTFYGHFSGSGSYRVVCAALAEWMTYRGIKFKQIDLRTDEEIIKLSRLVDYGCKLVPSHKTGKAFLFGFPTWWLVLPKHEYKIGFHVADSLPLPIPWQDTLKVPDIILTPSDYVSTLFSHYTNKPKYVIPHGISSKIEPKWKARFHKGVKFGHFCSELYPSRKCTEELIEAFCSLHWSDVELTIWTESVIVKRMVEHKNDGRIILKKLKFLDEDTHYKRLYGLDFLVAPSRSEGFGIIPLEALASATPVIMTNLTGHQQYFSTIESGVIETSITDLVACLNEAYFNHESYHKNAFQSAPKVVEQWNWKTVLDNSLLYDTLTV